MVRFDPALRLPTDHELPDSDDTPVDNELQIPVAGVLRAILTLLWTQRQDWFFGINMGIYADTENPSTAIVPDGFLCGKNEAAEAPRVNTCLGTQVFRVNPL